LGLDAEKITNGKEFQNLVKAMFEGNTYDRLIIFHGFLGAWPEMQQRSIIRREEYSYATIPYTTTRKYNTNT
jgi:hypothetical protein